MEGVDHKFMKKNIKIFTMCMCGVPEIITETKLQRCDSGRDYQTVLNGMNGLNGIARNKEAYTEYHHLVLFLWTP